MTKPLPAAPFEKHRATLGVHNVLDYGDFPTCDREITDLEWQQALKQNSSGGKSGADAKQSRVWSAIAKCPRRAASFVQQNPSVRQHCVRLLLHLLRHSGIVSPQVAKLAPPVSQV